VSLLRDVPIHPFDRTEQRIMTAAHHPRGHVRHSQYCHDSWIRSLRLYRFVIPAECRRNLRSCEEHRGGLRVVILDTRAVDVWERCLMVDFGVRSRAIVISCVHPRRIWLSIGGAAFLRELDRQKGKVRA
jgi:hypothetical protein